jgi:putative addiction module killer protein
MEARERQLLYYETEDGKQPFREWFQSLKDRETRNKIRARMDRVSLGNFGYCKPVGEGVSELKIDFGPGFRVYFGQVRDEIVLLLLGGDKKSQKRDIEIARDYWADYRRRYGKG